MLIYATLAATQRMTIDAKKIGDAQSRAWLSASCKLDTHNVQKSQNGREGIFINANVSLTNQGRSPATNIFFMQK